VPAVGVPEACGIARIMWAAEDAWRASLREHTVAELLDSALRHSPPSQLAAGAAWIQEAIR